jgi:hypothetical protein
LKGVPDEGAVLKKLAKSAGQLLMPIILSSLAAAQTVSGTVTNGTTCKPAEDDEVVIANRLFW